jgi:multicomponent Na+:H+ antiporter subunit G
MTLPPLPDILVVSLVAVGTALSLLAAIGILRMPDLYMRMQAATKAGTLGLACLVAAAAVHFADAFIAVQCALICLFLFLTSPVASHLVARAGYVGGVRPWRRTTRDDFAQAARPLHKP